MEILFCQLSFYALESHMAGLSSMLLFFETTQWGQLRTLLLMSCDLCFDPHYPQESHENRSNKADAPSQSKGSMNAATCLRK